MESRDQLLREKDLKTDYLRMLAYPFSPEVKAFVERHPRVYVVEQNRDAQLAALLKLDLPAELITRLRPVAHIPGLPLDARSVTDEIAGPGGPVAMAEKTNRLGLTQADYKGSKTTLCAGCGHNAISERFSSHCMNSASRPSGWRSCRGIGCSSQDPGLLPGRAHGFNAVHGRMPSVATGALMANRTLISIGVYGDGDTAYIGVGQFMHLLAATCRWSTSSRTTAATA